MKKLLAVFLALIMILSVSLVACSDKKDKNTDDNEIEEDNDFVPNNSTQTTAATTGDEEEDPPSTTGAPSNTWVEKTGTVYVCANETNVRKGPGTSYGKLGKVNIGYTINYTGTNGEFYKFNYNGQDGYISVKFTDSVKSNTVFVAPTTPAVNTAIHIKPDTTLKLRTEPCQVEDADIIKAYLNSASTANGEMTILEISESGLWVKVHFKGKDSQGREVVEGDYYCGANYIQEFSSTDVGGHG